MVSFDRLDQDSTHNNRIRWRLSDVSFCRWIWLTRSHPDSSASVSRYLPVTGASQNRPTAPREIHNLANGGAEPSLITASSGHRGVIRMAVTNFKLHRRT